MSEQELKKNFIKKLTKLLDDLDINIYIQGTSKVFATFGLSEEDIEHIADRLIAAGIGDVGELKKHRAQIMKDGTIKQLYSGEEVEKIVKERKELKDELRLKVEYIHEQDEVIKEYKHRAARAERALENACVVILSSRNGDQPRRLRAYYKAYLEAAEKELQEERKDEQFYL